MKVSNFKINFSTINNITKEKINFSARIKFYFVNEEKNDKITHIAELINEYFEKEKEKATLEGLESYLFGKTECPVIFEHFKGNVPLAGNEIKIQVIS